MSELIENTLSTYWFDVALVKTNKSWPADWLNEMKSAIVKHGGNMTERDGYCFWYFPAGTIERQVFPVVSMDKWKIFMPDGLEINKHELPGGRGWTLHFPDDCFSESIQEKYANK